MAAAAAPDFHLGGGPHQSGLGCCKLFTAELLFEARLSRLTRLFGLGFVNAGGVHRHVGHDIDVFAGNLDEAFPHRGVVGLSARMNRQLARNNLGEQRFVLRENAHLALDAGQHDPVGLHLLIDAFGRDNLEFQCGSHYVVGSFKF